MGGTEMREESESGSLYFFEVNISEKALVVHHV